MNKILLILSLIIVTQTTAQKKKDTTGILPYENSKIHFTSIVMLDSTYDQKTLYDNALIWFSKETNTYNNRLQHKDKFGLKDNIMINNRADGEFVGTLNTLTNQSFNQILIAFDVYVYTKNGKYKYDFTNFKYLTNAMMNAFSGNQVNVVTNFEAFDFKGNKNLVKALNENCLALINSLKEQMTIKKPNKDF
ncbi:MAG: DUF4468 domain-containing protein [Bacteroidota bacterium]|nr:DUF4468 domain-containing protein [Bacteroidota bacterium]